MSSHLGETGRLLRAEVAFPRRLRALIVEDDPMDLAILQKVATQVEGDLALEVSAVSNPDVVVTTLARGFDVVLLDFMLGAKTGLDVLKAVRRTGDETPVIFITSAADVHVASMAIKSGAYDYLLKTELTPDLLRRTILHAVHAREAEVGRRALEQRVRSLERLDAVALFAGGIAHDFNNLLTGITGWAGLGLDSMAPDGDREPLQKILETAKRASDLVAKLLDATRRSEDEVGPVSLADVARAAHDALAAERPPGIEVSFEAPEGEKAWVQGDQKRLELAVGNLVQNAVEAMPRGGKLAIRLRRERLAAPGDPTGGARAAVIEVEDTGAGIDPSVRDRIFDAYFTTKDTPSKKGLGLGLTLVQGVARSHRGRIDVQSKPGRTLFRFVVPVIDRAAGPS